MSTVILPPIQNTTMLDGLNNKNLYPIPQPSTDLLYNYAFFFVTDEDSTFTVPSSEDGKPLILTIHGYGYANIFNIQLTDYNMRFKIKNESGVTIHTILDGKIYSGTSKAIYSPEVIQTYASIHAGYTITNGSTQDIHLYNDSDNSDRYGTSPIELQCLIFYEAS